LQIIREISTHVSNKWKDAITLYNNMEIGLCFAGVVSNEGHCPSSSDPNWDRFFSIALMGRYADDLATTLKVMAGENAPQLNLDQKVCV
jgi:hypothetical protein